MASDNIEQLDVTIKKLDLEKRQEEIKQLRSRNKLSWTTPATILSIIPLIGGLGAWSLSEIKQYSDSYQALNKVAVLEAKHEELTKEIDRRQVEIRNQKQELNTEIQTLIAQKRDYRDETKRERKITESLTKDKDKLQKDITKLISDIGSLAAEFRTLRYLQDALEATNIEDSRSMMTLLHVVRQSYDEKDETAKHIVKKVLIVQTLGSIAFASSDRARGAAVDNWNLLDEYLHKSPWFGSFLDHHKDQIQTITSGNEKPAKTRESLLRISQDLRQAIADSGSEDKYLDPIRPMKVRWFDQAQRAAERLVDAAQEGRDFEEVRLFCNQFWRMYCCELVLVEEGGVAGAMVGFGEVLKKWETSDNGIVSESMRNEIRDRLIQLQEAAKEEGTN